MDGQLPDRLLRDAAVQADLAAMDKCAFIYFRYALHRAQDAGTHSLGCMSVCVRWPHHDVLLSRGTNQQQKKSKIRFSVNVQGVWHQVL